MPSTAVGGRRDIPLPLSTLDHPPGEDRCGCDVAADGLGRPAGTPAFRRAVRADTVGGTLHGDLRLTARVRQDECAPDHVGATLSGSLAQPFYADHADLNATEVEDTAVPVADLLVPEVIAVGGGVDGDAPGERPVAGPPVPAV
ncbi:hypothetical protein FHX81_7719 [Saccharothrix saharensis]|uniref:Uncharacterized protein n=1 Tax=Saccharothrix saharensis TaxID=571190 RepID=A0A543JQV3_9PSEU|nr:hypothetical protein [Saccharothrix saharensis]TQM85241.1 hypothetical protein FHX81_7719 [Saccharothrix saharensis]